LNPCGLGVDCGRDWPHITTIYPFRDRPDVGVEVLFYPVAEGVGYVPYDNPFTLRNWDRLEQEPEPILGTRYDRKVYYYGPLPEPQPQTLTGTADEWRNGLLYATYVANGYHSDCEEWVMPHFVIDLYSPNSSLAVDPHDGHVLVDIDLEHTNEWAADQVFLKTVRFDVTAEDPLGYLAIEVVGDLGSGATDVLQVNLNGMHLIHGSLLINGENTSNGYAFRVRQSSNNIGVLVAVHNTASGRPLSVERSGGNVQFGVGPDGEIVTDVLGATAPTGGPAGYLAVYDSSGTLLGYVTVNAP